MNTKFLKKGKSKRQLGLQNIKADNRLSITPKDFLLLLGNFKGLSVSLFLNSFIFILYEALKTVV